MGHPVLAEPSHDTLRGRVVHLFYQSPQFTAGVLKGADGKARFSGPIMVAAGDEVTLIGQWTQHPQYGPQFAAQGLRQELPVDPDALAAYLAADPSFRGMGPEKARRLVAACGTDVDRVLREEPARVAAIAQVSLAVAEGLRDAWVAREDTHALTAWLYGLGLTHRQVTRLLEGLGHNAKALLEADPYQLCHLLPGFGFTRVDEMALRMGVVKHHPGRMAAALQQVLLKAEQDGHCWVEEDVLLREAGRLLCLDRLDAGRQVADALDAALAAGRLTRHDGEGRWVIARPELATRERDVLDLLLQRRGRPVDAQPWAPTLDAVAPSLNASQRAAALMALASAVSLIAGAAGSGKSYTIAAIDRAFTAAGYDVVLAAPTGKAAKRMEQLCGREAKTIHRLLEYNTQAWGRHAEHPLDADVVILDEVGMCDVPLLWHVLTAIDPSRTQLVLVGDPNQLPPVGPGNVLRDLLARQIIPTAVLDQVVRQAGVLKEHSTAILRGTVCDTADGTSGVLRPWYLIDDCATEAQVLATLETLVCDALPRLGVDPVADTQILTPSHKGPLGTRALNRLLQRLIQAERFGVAVPPVPEPRRPVLYPGDKIMQTRNNYELDLMNGALGVVQAVERETTGPQAGTEMLVLAFEGRTLRVPRQSDAADDLMLAYASTVHKCQGSEFPVVIAVAHRSHTFMLSRNLLYTAVTRAQRSVILLGDPTGLRRAVTNRTVAQRRTFLGLLDPEALVGGAA